MGTYAKRRFDENDIAVKNKICELITAVQDIVFLFGAETREGRKARGRLDEAEMWASAAIAAASHKSVKRACDFIDSSYELITKSTALASVLTALEENVSDLCWYGPNKNDKLTPGASSEEDAYVKYSDVLCIIDELNKGIKEVLR